jgi:hypothetical protein
LEIFTTRERKREEEKYLRNGCANEQSKHLETWKYIEILVLVVVASVKAANSRREAKWLNSRV